MNTITRIEKMREEWAGNDAKRDAGLTEPEGIIKEENISYGPFGKDNLLDIFMPENHEGIPLILNIHGGGYFYGDKELYRFYCMHMAQLGFKVISINYRLSPENNFPAPLDDIDMVMSWIEKNQKTLGIKENSVILMGDSAGAQLASQYATIATNDKYRKLFGYEKHCIGIKGLCLACGMYNLIESSDNKDTDFLLENYYGSEIKKNDSRLDVISNITDKYPPVYIFSSKDDFLRDLCLPMVNLLKERGVYVKSHIYGLDMAEEIGHVFHLDMHSDIGRQANIDQAEFISGL